MRRDHVKTAVSELGTLAVASVMAAGVLGVSHQAEAGVAQRTTFLQTSITPSAGMNVTWHPGFRQYYAAGSGSGDAGSFYSKLYVFSEAGSEVQAFFEVEHDLRSVNYNPNTGQLEVLTLRARDGGIGAVGGRPQGLFAVPLDAAGQVTGSTTMLLPSLPGLRGTQTMPVYDSARNRLYSFSNTNVLNVVSRVDGSLIGNVTLDTAAAGSPPTTWFGLGYDAVNDYLVATAYAPINKAMRFRVDGSYVDSWDLDIDVPQFYGGVSVANDQLFVYDNARNGWQGYTIPSPGSLALLGLAAAATCRRRR